MRRALLVDIDDTVVDWLGPAREALGLQPAGRVATALLNDGQ